MAPSKQHEQAPTYEQTRLPTRCSSRNPEGRDRTKSRWEHHGAWVLGVPDHWGGEGGLQGAPWCPRSGAQAEGSNCCPLSTGLGWGGQRFSIFEKFFISTGVSSFPGMFLLSTGISAKRETKAFPTRAPPYTDRPGVKSKPVQSEQGLLLLRLPLARMSSRFQLHRAAGKEEGPWFKVPKWVSERGGFMEGGKKAKLNFKSMFPVCLFREFLAQLVHELKILCITGRDPFTLS